MYFAPWSAAGTTVLNLTGPRRFVFAKNVGQFIRKLRRPGLAARDRARPLRPSRPFHLPVDIHLTLQPAPRDRPALQKYTKNPAEDERLHFDPECLPPLRSLSLPTSAYRGHLFPPAIFSSSTMPPTLALALALPASQPHPTLQHRAAVPTEQPWSVYRARECGRAD